MSQLGGVLSKLVQLKYTTEKIVVEVIIFFLFQEEPFQRHFDHISNLFRATWND